MIDPGLKTVGNLADIGSNDGGTIPRWIRGTDVMAVMNRRSALTLALAAASAAAAPAMGQNLRATPQGREVAPGVWLVQRGKRASMIPAYKSVSMRDFVYQPKARFATGLPMKNDMVCHCPQGELRVKQTPGEEFVVKAGDVWSCNKGLLEESENIGTGTAIMRVIDFLPT